MSNASDFIIENGVLKKYVGLGGDVVIPAGVTIVGTEAFDNCEHLKSVVIPAGVTCIESNAFYGCCNLASVVIPAGVTSIRSGAFYGCCSLANAVIPEGITSIEMGLFQCCSSLTSAIIPAGVTSIGNDAFRGCSSLTNVVIPDDVHKFGTAVFHMCEKLADAAGFVIVRNVLYSYHGSGGKIVIPDGVTKISSFAFYGCEQLQVVTIPESVLEIGHQAFFGCSYLRRIDGADNVEIVEDIAFQHCWRLESITLKNAKKIGYKAFDTCMRFRSLFAPNVGIEAIKKLDAMRPAAAAYLLRSEAYHDTDSVAEYNKYVSAQKKKFLPEIFAADTVQAIALYARLGKITAKNVDEDFLIPAQEAGAQQCVAFLLEWKEKNVSEEYMERQMQRELEKNPYNVTDMKKLWRYRTLLDGTLEIYGYKGKAPDVYIPERIGKTPVTAIEEYTFGAVETGRTTIVSITVPESVTKIGAAAFRGCTELRSVVLSCKLTEINNYMFDGCQHLQSVVVPDGVTKIGSGAFSGCSELSSAVIPRGVSNIGPSFFRECFSLRDLWLPASVIKINKQAFKDCPKLTIHAPAGSYAETYAKENNIPFVAE